MDNWIHRQQEKNLKLSNAFTKAFFPMSTNTNIEGSGESGNQQMTIAEAAKIRQLQDFDLLMLVSEIHDHGWPDARVTLGMMPPNPATESELRQLQEAAAKAKK